MKNKKTFIIILIIITILIIIAIAQGIILVNIKQENERIENNKTDTIITETTNIKLSNTENTSTSNIEPITYTVTEDTKKFKQEYEALNNTAVRNGGENYNTVNISEENPIVYVNLEQLVNVINSEEKSYIFISSPTCIYCRAIVEKLFEVTRNLGIEKLYYFDVSSNLEFEDETKKQELLDKLVEKNIIAKNTQGNVSWSMPLVLKTQSGEVLSKKVGMSGISLNIEQNQYSDLTEEQKQQIYNIYYYLLKN